MKRYKVMACITKKTVLEIDAETKDVARIKVRRMIAEDHPFAYVEQTVELNIEEKV